MQHAAAALPHPRPAPPDLDTLPANVDRKEGAALVRRYFFPISPRSLERWALPSRVVAGKAVVSTAALFAIAREKMNAAPVTMSGSAPKVAA